MPVALVAVLAEPEQPGIHHTNDRLLENIAVGVESDRAVTVVGLDVNSPTTIYRDNTVAREGCAAAGQVANGAIGGYGPSVWGYVDRGTAEWAGKERFKDDA